MISHPYQPRTYPSDRIAITACETGETLTFGQLEERANQGAHALRSLGVKAGGHIAILMENRLEYLEVSFAADRTGVYYTTISIHLTEDEIGYILSDCGAQVLITSDKYFEAARNLPQIATGNCALMVVGKTGAEQESWQALASAQPTTPIADEAQGLDMIYSSGTTGRPKGIKWPLETAAPGGKTMLVEILTQLFGYSAKTRYLSLTPFYHAAPLRHSMVTLKMGGSVYFTGRFDAREALRCIERYAITHSQWVPTMLIRLLKLPAEDRESVDVSSLQMAVHAAAPCPIDVKRKMIDWWGPIIHEYYAGTENNGFTAITTSEWLDHTGSVGQAKLGVIHICDEQGEELPVGTVGEIYFENGHQFAYHNDAEKTKASTNGKGWTTLGDIGRVDDQGYLYLTDRKSFVIISGGVNIYPQETEDVLLSHPLIMDAAVIGVPNEDFGEEVKAVVQLEDGSAGSEDLEAQLIAYCGEKLSKFKCPRSVDFRDTLPRSTTGKLYKRKLRDEFWPDKS